MTQKERYEKVLAYFEEAMPSASSELNFEDAYQLLVAVMLSAQCTDKRVNMVTPALFEKYPDADALSKATEEEVLEYVKSVSYPNSKSRHLVGMAQRVVEAFEGQIPSDVDELQTLPGVGRKTANVVTAVLYNQPNMPVDTHVFRVSNRIGLTNHSKTPLETEKTLTRHIPKNKIPVAHHWLILHGRYVCTARKPQCEKCGISTYCKSFKTQ